MTVEIDRSSIDADLVRRLVADQFPQWAGLPVEPVEPGGWSNRTFRLGDEFVVRLPSAERYVAETEKEQRWLPALARELPLPIPEPVGLGSPGEGYPWPWSVYRWIEGAPAEKGPIEDMEAFAGDLGAFLQALRQVNSDDAPPAGQHNFHRGGDLAVYADETEAALESLGETVDQAACRAIWDTALSSRWEHAPVWVHGDVSASNLLVRDGRLSAVLDFGSSAIGDPACDLYIAWTFLDAPGRAALRRTVGLDAAAWARGRGWTLWKALIVMAGRRDGAPDGWAQTVVAEIIGDHEVENG
ncbi:MAG: aminoglycoside phosphotransferase family protein [Rhizobiaceae bacterium]